MELQPEGISSFRTSNPCWSSWSWGSPCHAAQNLASQSINMFRTKGPRPKCCAKDAPPWPAHPGTRDRDSGCCDVAGEVEATSPPASSDSAGGRWSWEQGDAWESFLIAEEDEDKPPRQTPQSKYRWESTLGICFMRKHTHKSG